MLRLEWIAAKKWWKILTCIMLLFYIVFFVEETKTVLSFYGWPLIARQSAKEQGKTIRVISLNCNSEIKAAFEVLQYRPDLVLLQEVPPQNKITQLAHRFFGDNAGIAYGIDTAVIARGKIQKNTMPLSRLSVIMTQASVDLSAGQNIKVFSLRLLTPPVRFDFWSPSFWNEYMANRLAHREEIKQVMAYAGSFSPKTNVILGGDLNASAYDAVFHAFQPRLRDAFKDAGIGLGNTMTNDFPLVRIDHIWVSERFKPVSVIVRKTQHSDHRMVIADLIMNEPTKR